MLTKTRAIVLGTVKYGERKIFVSMYSEQYGMITFSYALPQRGKTASKASVLQPLSIVEVEFDLRPKAEIHYFRDVRACVPLMSIQIDARKLAITMFLAEFLKFALQNEQANAPLFNYLCHSIEWLDTARDGFANFHLVFVTKILMFIGFYPNAENFQPGSWFDLRDGAFTPFIPPHKEFVSPSEASIIPLLSRLSFRTMHLLLLSRAQRNKCMEQMLAYCRLHLPHFPELRSFAVMQELFA